MDKSEEAASLTATRAGGGVMNEQEQFEAWVNSLNPGWLLDKTKNDGDYVFPRAYAGWQAWQAAIATQQAHIDALEKASNTAVADYKRWVLPQYGAVDGLDELAALLQEPSE